MTGPRHDWTSLPSISLSGRETPDGNDRTEKTCSRCSLVKITVHPPQGFPWREWRHANGSSFQCESTPPCISVVSDSADGAASAERETSGTTA